MMRQQEAPPHPQSVEHVDVDIVQAPLEQDSFLRSPSPLEGLLLGTFFLLIITIFLVVRKKFCKATPMVTVNVYTSPAKGWKGRADWLRQSFRGLRLSLRSGPAEEGEASAKAEAEEIDQLRQENRQLKEEEREYP